MAKKRFFVITCTSQIVQIRNLAGIKLYCIFNQAVSCCSHPGHLSHESLAQTNVTACHHHHVFVAHLNLRNLSLPANGKWGLKQYFYSLLKQYLYSLLKQYFYSLFRPGGEVIMTTGLRIMTQTRTVSKKKR